MPPGCSGMVWQLKLPVRLVLCGPTRLAKPVLCIGLKVEFNHRLAGRWAQVCLAAERCGNLDFDTRLDTWYSSEGFHCSEAPAGDVGFWDIYWKVCGHGITPTHAAGCWACCSWRLHWHAALLLSA